MLGAIRKILDASPTLQAAVNIKFETDTSILDLAAGIVRYTEQQQHAEQQEPRKWQIFKFDYVINATGKIDKAKELAESHEKKFKHYQYKEKLVKHAAVQFFLPHGDDVAVPGFIRDIVVGDNYLQNRKWDQEKQPEVYCLSKSFAKGSIISVIGEYPPTIGENRDAIKEWMKVILQHALSKCKIDGKELQYMELKYEEPPYLDPSLREQLEYLYATTFSTNMMHMESPIYLNEDVGGTLSITIGDSSSSPNPHLATGAKSAIFAGISVGKYFAYAATDMLGKAAELLDCAANLTELNEFLVGNFEHMNLMMRQANKRYGYERFQNNPVYPGYITNSAKNSVDLKTLRDEIMSLIVAMLEIEHKFKAKGIEFSTARIRGKLSRASKTNSIESLNEVLQAAKKDFEKMNAQLASLTKKPSGDITN